MSRKTMIINGEEFEVIKPRKYNPVPHEFTPRDCTDIFQAYATPSDSKVFIFQHWLNWAPFKWCTNESVYVSHFCITSHNCQMFCIGFNIYNTETDEFIGVGSITRDHNRIYLAREV